MKNYHCHTWIKAEPTFEGLKQIIYESKLRCKIQKENPDIKIPHKCIKSVSFKGHNDFIENKIFFNNDLNTIIGGKSSGKSLLLHYIANTINYKYAVKQQNPNNKNIEDKLKDKYGFSEQEGFDFEITWNDGVTYKFSERETVKDRKFVYIPQSYILNLTDNIRTKSRKTLGKFIRDILLQDEKSNELYKEFLVAVKNLDNSRDSQIDLYFKNEDAVETLEKEKKGIGDKEGIKNYIESQDSVLQTLKKNANITDNELNRYDSLNNRLEKINTYHSDLKLELNEIKENIEQQKSSFSHEYSAEDFEYNSAKEFIEKYNQIALESDKKLNSLNSEIENKESSIKTRVDSIKLTIEQELKPITSKLKEKTKIKAIEDTIKKEKTKLNRIEKIEESINGHHTQERIKIKAKIIELYKEAYDEYDKIIDILNKRGKDFEDINLIGTVKFYHKRYRENLLPFFNRNSTKTREVLDLNLCKDHGNLLPDVVYNIHFQEIESVFDKIVNDELLFTKHRDKKDCVKALFKDEFFDYWELKIKNDEMANMSPGKANLVILKLLVELSESDAPILIDQPEDNLDNRSIYHDLVQFLRKRKDDRQIIIVSHNPNIVVSADSENVIVANQKDQDEGRDNKEYRFEYINGALENSFKLSDDKKEDIGILKSMGIREHVTDILEGGEEVFLKREEKYGF
ncbi:TrlF family AAA-like ATPase [Aquimarina mytili]|uniref:TrlF family AAA-like ATPase n=1 Tax=Aquimarina mytili TaxID=874423 RepID=UPI0037427557